MYLIQHKPEVLRLYGMDPDQIKNEIEKSIEMQKDIDKNFETKYKGSFATEWQSFIEKYQKTL